uniref:Uncharacterized protein n=1 Tax=Euplotes harpa TaxID=151035 RepID=A0A7S3JEH8_9SPIT|mmetsp:Transcript_31224/g.35647  ORF Transcript_31224/g.35647 Transcript_31224/m.35647 type:complete len:180 (+) Transcript_31224:593-1132(+)
MYKSCTSLCEEIKTKNMTKFEATMKNKVGVDKNNRERVKKTIVNKDKNFKAIEEQQQKVKHEIMLKQEMRKLRELDIMKVQERNRRLDAIKKNSIIEKEQAYSKAISSLKSENEQFTKKIIEDDIKDLKSKDQLDKALISVTKSLEPSEKRNKMLADNNFKISISEKFYKKPANENGEF